MASELELKAVIRDVGALRAALDRVGAVRTFRGMMRDRRLDCGGRLTALDQVLRLRTFEAEAGTSRCEVTWKGSTTVTETGYKQREELACDMSDGPAAFAVFQALGYQVVHAIDRFVEVWEQGGVTARLEWYPRMDPLLEIEGAPEGMEHLITALGLDRSECLPDALAEFGARYAVRTGQPAKWAEVDLAGAAPGWRDA